MRYMPTGQYAEEMHGELEEGAGFDGINYWGVDPSGYPTLEKFEDAESDQAIETLLTDRWLRPGDLQGVTVVRSSPQDTVLRINERGSSLAESIDIDSHTWLPKSGSFRTHSGTVKIFLSGWSSVGGEKAPFHSVVNDGGALITRNFRRSSTSLVASRQAYVMPKKLPREASYDAALPPQVETRGLGGVVFVHPLINGRDVGWFILDSCAGSMMIDEKAADSLSLSKFGGTAVTGVGGTIVEPFRRASELELGPARMRNVLFCQMDASFLGDAFGRPIGGIVGSDVLKRFVVSIDVQRPSVAIYDRDVFRLRLGGAWEPLTFVDGDPAIEAAFDGNRHGLFHLDTGSIYPVTFESPFVKAAHLLANRRGASISATGFGGSASICFGKLDWLKLGGRRFSGINCGYSLTSSGALAMKDVIGVIGIPMMSSFNIVFDFGGNRVAFLPSA